MHTFTLIFKGIMTILLFYVIALFSAAGVMIFGDLDHFSSRALVVVLTIGGDLTLVWAIISIWRYRHGN